MSNQFGLTATQILTKEQIEGLASLAWSIPVEDVLDYVRHLDRIEAFAPILAPGEYMSVRKTLPDHQKLARAFWAFRQALEAFRPKGGET